MRRARYLTLPLVLAAAATLTLSAAWQGATDRARAAAAPASVPNGHDYATDVFHDPWDYSNPSDVLLDTGPAQGLVRPALSGGSLSFGVTHKGGYFSPLWGGYQSEVPIGREGTVAANAINTATYTRMYLHIYVSSFAAASLSWTRCVQMTSSCIGSMSFQVHTGWNDIDLRIARTSGNLSWSGRMTGLRLAMTSGGASASVRLDSMSIYQPSIASSLTWSAPGRSPSTLWWTSSTGTISTPLSQNSGLVPNASGSANSSARVKAYVAQYAPNTYFWSVAVDGTKTRIGQTAPSPLPNVDTPGATGCVDYATRYLGHPWTFTSTRSLASYANMTALAFTAAGVMSATNAGPHRNDPNISLPLARGGIDGRVYHRLSFVESYDGPFDLQNAPGGGTHARILWQSPGYVALSQTAPLVTYSGRRTLTVDLAMSTSVLTDRAGTAGQRYPFASTRPITRLRYDPNEDPGARRWHLESVTLAADCQAAYHATVAWHDGHYSAGSTVRLVARTAGGHTYALGSFAEHAGQNTALVSVNTLPVYTYSVIAYVTNTAHVTVAAASSGPLVVKR